MGKPPRIGVLFGVLLIVCSAMAVAAKEGGKKAESAKAKPDSVHGVVKGAPAGKTFVVARKGGSGSGERMS